MGTSKVYSAQLSGLEIEKVLIEVDITYGLHSFSIVGLGDRAIGEAKDRISAAIKNSGYISPKQRNHKVVISLSPAGLRKEGSSFDLSMAIAYLKASGDIQCNTDSILFIGELSLEGKVIKVPGLLPILCNAEMHHFTSIIIPAANMNEAGMVKDLLIYGVSSLSEVIDHICSKNILKPIKQNQQDNNSSIYNCDMRQIRGNETAKRGLEIAAAGSHNVLLYGPSGTGKTMLAQTFVSILPSLSYEQAIEVTKIHSAAQILHEELMFQPPFRSPHHTSSYTAILGGGSVPKPGEITLAHQGVLFMDEFSEFDKEVIESLRQPLENKEITIRRNKISISYPAQCILIASMNACPCGKSRDDGCTCSSFQIEKYWRKLSGPILDRIDIFLNVNKIDYNKLAETKGESDTSETVRIRVQEARLMQDKRFKDRGIHKSFNSDMSADDIEKCIYMENTAREILLLSSKKMHFSGRVFHRIIKVARTIADLDKQETIKKEHILEALQYRQKLFC